VAIFNPRFLGLGGAPIRVPITNPRLAPPPDPRVTSLSFPDPTAAQNMYLAGYSPNSIAVQTANVPNLPPGVPIRPAPRPLAPLPVHAGRPPAPPPPAPAGVNTSRPLAPLPGMYGRPPAPPPAVPVIPPGTTVPTEGPLTTDPRIGEQRARLPQPGLLPLGYGGRLERPPAPTYQPVLTGDPRIDAPILAQTNPALLPSGYGGRIEPPAPPSSAPPGPARVGEGEGPGGRGPEAAPMQTGEAGFRQQEAEQRVVAYRALTAQGQTPEQARTGALTNTQGAIDTYVMPGLTAERTQQQAAYQDAQRDWQIVLGWYTGNMVGAEPWIRAELEDQLGRPPTPDEMRAEIARLNGEYAALTPEQRSARLQAAKERYDLAIATYAQADATIVYLGGESDGALEEFGLLDALDWSRGQTVTGVGWYGYQLATGQIDPATQGSGGAAYGFFDPLLALGQFSDLFGFGPGHFDAWVLDNRQAVADAYTNGYNGFTGGRAVWELYASTLNPAQKIAYDIVLDPLNYLAVVGMGGKAIRTGGTAAREAATTTGGRALGGVRQVIGGALEAPTVLLDRPIDYVVGGVARGLRDVTGELFRPTREAATVERIGGAGDTVTNMIALDPTDTAGGVGLGPAAAAPTTPGQPTGGRAVPQSGRTVTETRVEGRLRWTDPSSGYSVELVQEPTERVLPGREGTVPTRGVYVLRDPNGQIVGTYGSTDQAWKAADAGPGAFGDQPAPGARTQATPANQPPPLGVLPVSPAPAATPPPATVTPPPASMPPTSARTATEAPAPAVVTREAAETAPAETPTPRPEETPAAPETPAPTPETRPAPSVQREEPTRIPRETPEPFVEPTPAATRIPRQEDVPFVKARDRARPQDATDTRSLTRLARERGPAAEAEVHRRIGRARYQQHYRLMDDPNVPQPDKDVAAARFEVERRAVMRDIAPDFDPGEPALTRITPRSKETPPGDPTTARLADMTMWRETRNPTKSLYSPRDLHQMAMQRAAYRSWDSPLGTEARARLYADGVLSKAPPSTTVVEDIEKGTYTNPRGGPNAKVPHTKELVETLPKRSLEQRRRLAEEYRRGQQAAYERYQAVREVRAGIDPTDPMLDTAVRQAAEAVPAGQVVGAGPIQGGPADALLIPPERSTGLFSVPTGVGPPPPVGSVAPPPGQVVRQGDQFVMTDPATGAPMAHATEAQARAHAAQATPEQIVPSAEQNVPAGAPPQTTPGGNPYTLTRTEYRGSPVERYLIATPAGPFEVSGPGGGRNPWRVEPAGIGDARPRISLGDQGHPTAESAIRAVDRVGGTPAASATPPPGAMPGSGPFIPSALYDYFTTPVTPLAQQRPGPILNDAPLRTWRGHPSITQFDLDTLSTRLSTGERLGEFVERRLDEELAKVKPEGALAAGLSGTAARAAIEREVLPGILRELAEQELKAAGHSTPFISAFLKLWDPVSTALSKLLRVNPITGPAYILLNLLGNAAIDVLTGHPAAALRSLDPRAIRQTFRYLRGEGSLAEHAAQYADVLSGGRAPSPVMQLSRDEYGMVTTGATAGVAHRAGLDWPSQIANVLKSLGAPKVWQDLARAVDLNNRLAIYSTEMGQRLPGEVAQLADTAAARGARLNLDQGLIRAAIDGLGPIIDPNALRRTMRDLAMRGKLDRGAAENFAERVMRDWREQYRTFSEGVSGETRAVMFGGPETNADAIIRRFFFFHYWNSRASVLYAREAIRHPGILNAYVKGLAELKEMANEEGRPPWLATWLKVADSALGLAIYINPYAFVSTNFLFSEPGDERPFWQQALPMLHPAIDAAMYAIGGADGIREFLTGRGPEAAPSIPGIAQMSRFLTAMTNVARSQFSDEYGAVFDPAREIMPTVRETVTGWLGNPEAMPNPNATAESTLNTFVIEEGRKRGYTDAQIMAAMNDESDEAYQAAYERWSLANAAVEAYRVIRPVPITTRGAIRDDLMIENRVVGPGGQQAYQETHNGAEMPEGYDPYTDGAAGTQFLDLIEERTGTRPNQEQVAAAWVDTESDTALYQASSQTEEARALQIEIDGAEAVGTEAGREALDTWNQIAYGEAETYGGTTGRTRPEPITIGGRSYTMSEFAMLPDDLREGLANQWAQERGYDDDIAAQRSANDAYKAAHPDYAAYRDWQRDVGRHAAGPVGWWENEARTNPAAAEYLARAREDGATGDALEARLMGPDAYLAYQGFAGTVFEPELPAARPSPVGAGQQQYPPSDPAESIATEVYLYRAEVQAASVVLIAYGIPPTVFEWGTDQEQAYARQILSQHGMSIPTLSSDAKTYLRWASAQQASGGDTSIPAFLAWRTSAEAAAAGVTAPFYLEMAGGDPYSGFMQDPMAMLLGLGMGPMGLGENNYGYGPGGPPNMGTRLDRPRFNAGPNFAQLGGTLGTRMPR